MQAFVPDSLFREDLERFSEECRYRAQSGKIGDKDIAQTIRMTLETTPNDATHCRDKLGNDEKG